MCILQVILLCAWVSLMDTLVGILMDLIGFMYVRYDVGHENLNG